MMKTAKTASVAKASVLKRGLDFIQLWVYTLAVGVIAIIAFSTFNVMNNTANSTASVTSLMSKMSDTTEVKKLKIDKANIISVAQVGLNTTTAQAKAITITGDSKLVANEKGIMVAYEASNLANGTNTTTFDTANFTETDVAAPKIFLYSNIKLSQDVKGITLLGTGTVTDTAANTVALPVYVYQHNVTK